MAQPAEPPYTDPYVRWCDRESWRQPTYVDWCAAGLQMWQENVRLKRRNFPLFVDELAALHGEVYQVGAEAVFQIPIVAGVENQQIGGLAGLQRSDPFGAAQRVSAVDGSRANGLFDGHSQPPAGQRNHRLHIERRSMVRIEIAAQRHRRAGVDQRAGGSFLGIAAEGSAGQERGHDPRFGDLPDLGCGGVLQMIDTDDMVQCGECNGGGGAGSVGMNLAIELEIARPPHIKIEKGRRGGGAIPRQIGRVGHTAAADLGKQFGHHPFGGVPGPSIEFAGQAEKKAGDQVNRLPAQRAEHAQQLGFGALIESASGLYLHRGSTVSSHGFEGSARPNFQALPGDRVQRAHGGGRLRRVDAGRRESQVRVGVDEAGHHYPSGGVDLDGVPRLGQILHPPAGPHFHQDAIPNQDGAILDHIEFVERRPAARSPSAANCHQMAGTPDQNRLQFIPPPYCNISTATLYLIRTRTLILTMAIQTPPPGNKQIKTLERVFSKAGAGSRTDARSWIGAGRVRVNGKVVQNPDHWVDLENDRVTLDGKPLRSATKTYVLLYKPKGYLTTYRDPERRPTVYDLVPEVGAWISPVGRLDLDSSGLLILTNDTDFTERLTNPDHKVPKTYQIKASTLVSDEQIERLRQGVELADGVTRPAVVTRLRDSEKYSFLEMTITEGRNRQVRRMLEAVESKVLKLVRVAIGPIRIGGLPIGKWRNLPPQEVHALRGRAASKVIADRRHARQKELRG